MIDTVLLRDLPYENSDRVVTLWEYDKVANARSDVSAPNYVDWRAQAESFELDGAR